MRDRYTTHRQAFQWDIPARFNIGAAILADHVDDDRVALIDVQEDFRCTRYSFGELRQASARLANGLRGLGIRPGDRVGIFLSQSAPLAITHLATYLVGAVAVPLFTLFGDEALSYRIKDAGIAALVADVKDWPRLAAIRSEWGSLKWVLLTGREDDVSPDVLSWRRLIERSRTDFDPHPSRSDDPALIIYTSGTTGSPKGALHAHRVLLGHLPGVSMSHQSFPARNDMLWTPADWAWIGGLLDVLLPSLYCGVPVVAYRPRKFDPEQAMELLRRFPIQNIFFPPTALRLMRSVLRTPPAGVHLRTLASGGESLGADIYDWIRSTLKVDVAEFYGQTEANMIVSNAPDVFDPIPGSMGRAAYGHDVRMMTEDGHEAGVGEVGEVTVSVSDPVGFLGYWNRPEATLAKTRNHRIHTGDLAKKDDQGYLYFVGRVDDMINSAGYRIGPTEIEEIILHHPDVALVAVIGKPDPIRGEIIKAFIVPAHPNIPEDKLSEEIKALVRTRLGSHEYPREVSLVDALPMTTTGKIQRQILRQQEQQKMRHGNERPNL